MDYATVTQLTDKNNRVQVATLKTVMGTECKQVLNRLELTEEELSKTSTILEKLELYFAPERNILYERYLFHSAEQQPNETLDQYVLRLRKLAEPCKFEALHDDMLRDRLVLGSRDKAARARLFREKECTLTKAIDALQISEATLEQQRLWERRKILLTQSISNQGSGHVKTNPRIDQRRYQQEPVPLLLSSADTVEGSATQRGTGVQHMGNLVETVVNKITSSQFVDYRPKSRLMWWQNTVKKSLMNLYINWRK